MSITVRQTSVLGSTLIAAIAALSIAGSVSASETNTIERADPPHYSAFERLFIDELNCEALWPALYLYDPATESLIAPDALGPERAYLAGHLSAQPRACRDSLPAAELARLVGADKLSDRDLTLMMIDVPPVLVDSGLVPESILDHRAAMYEAFAAPQDLRRILVRLPSDGMRSPQ